MKLTALAPWFGSKRTLAPTVVELLGEHSYYFEGCAGSMAVLFAKEPSHHETVCDLHGALTNLGWVVQDDRLAPRLFDRLSRTMYGDDIFQRSKRWMERFESVPQAPSLFEEPSFEWAYHYFIASWMGRNGVSGTERVNYQLATRWTAGGGSGPLRFKNAVDSIPAWCDRLRNVLVLRRDLFEILPKVDDAPSTAIYVDPPYLHSTIAGNSRYLHDFTPEQHERLAKELRRFLRAKVVVSYYEADELRRLYEGWTFIDASRQKHLHVQNKRGTGRKTAPEVILVNRSIAVGNDVFSRLETA